MPVCNSFNKKIAACFSHRSFRSLSIPKSILNTYGFSNEAQHLLLENEIYLKALQRSSISVYSLGFDDLVLDPNKKRSSRRHEGKGANKILRPVIPTESQVPFLDRVEETMHYLELERQKEQEKRAKSAGRLFSSHSFQLDIPIILPKASSARSSPKFGQSPTKPKLPSFGRPTRRMIEELEQARRFAEQKEKEESRKKSILGKFSVSRDGKEYVYDYDGNRIPADEYESYKKEYQQKMIKKEKEREQKQNELYDLLQGLTNKNSNAKFKGAIVQKTSQYVDQLRHQIVAERAGKQRLPETTVAFEPGDEVLPMHHFYFFPEYLLLEKDDVMITIEYCHDCESHNWANHHVEEEYLNAANNIQDTLEIFMKDFPVRFFCLLKPIADLAQVRLERAKSISMLPNASLKLFESPPPTAGFFPGSNTNPFVSMTASSFSPMIGKESRTGALEVQIMIHTGSEKITHILHSKLLSGNWPRVEVILSEIEFLLTKFKYLRIRGQPYGIVRRRSSIDPNLFAKVHKKRPSSAHQLSPAEKQIEKLKKEVTLIPSFDQRKLKKTELSEFFASRQTVISTAPLTGITPSPASSSAPSKKEEVDIATIVPTFANHPSSNPNNTVEEKRSPTAVSPVPQSSNAASRAASPKPRTSKPEDDKPAVSPLPSNRSGMDPEKKVTVEEKKTTDNPPRSGSTTPKPETTTEKNQSLNHDTVVTSLSTKETLKLVQSTPELEVPLTVPQTEAKVTSTTEDPDHDYEGDFELESGNPSPMKVSRKPSLLLLHPTSANSATGVVSDNLEGVKQAVLDLQEMLRNDEYEDEQDDLNFTPGTTRSSRNPRNQQKRDSQAFWEDDIYRELGINSNEVNQE